MIKGLVFQEILAELSQMFIYGCFTDSSSQVFFFSMSDIGFCILSKLIDQSKFVVFYTLVEGRWLVVERVHWIHKGDIIVLEITSRYRIYAAH